MKQTNKKTKRQELLEGWRQRISTASENVEQWDDKQIEFIMLDDEIVTEGVLRIFIQSLLDAKDAEMEGESHDEHIKNIIGYLFNKYGEHDAKEFIDLIAYDPNRYYEYLLKLAKRGS